MTAVRLLFVFLVFCITGCDANRAPARAPDDAGKRYLERTLLTPPLRPGDLDDLSIECDLKVQDDTPLYRTVADTDYDQPGWERRVSSDWRFFNAPDDDSWLALIDFRRVRDGLAYRYLASDANHNRLYEPWSTSKVHAFTVAVSALRQHGIGADAAVGGVALSDLVTSIHTYAPSGNADGNSNDIATYLLNIAGRDYATALFHSAWLNVGNRDVRFRGAYGPSVFAPKPNVFVSRDAQTRYAPHMIDAAANDPGYLTYRCDQCGTNGNKAMTALAQTEWLKRLASHSREPATRHPHLDTSDVETLFYGGQHWNREGMAGMLSGISTFLPEALAQALDGSARNIAEASAKKTLDAATSGRWRVYQKAGWGPSETRGMSEVVMLAHVCLPEVGESGREFTLLARAAVPGADADESGVGRAGLKLSRMLAQSLSKLLRASTPE